MTSAALGWDGGLLERHPAHQPTEAPVLAQPCGGSGWSEPRAYVSTSCLASSIGSEPGRRAWPRSGPTPRPEPGCRPGRGGWDSPEGEPPPE
eukprot:8370676-Alexandrium_andersonii.AAC.1